MSELRNRVEKLRERLLELLSGAPSPKKGPTLAALCTKVCTKLGEEDRPLFEGYRDGLYAFEQMEPDRQLVEIARGLRLCQMVAGARSKERKKRVASTPLEESTESLKGIGPKMAELLADRGLETVEDLLWLVPRRYDDVRKVQPLGDLFHEPPLGERVVVRGDIWRVRYARRGARGWIDLRLRSDEGTLVIRWFGAKPGMCNRYEEGGSLVVAGKLSERGGVLEMAHPDVLAIRPAEGEEKVLVEGVVPRYGAIPGVPASTLRKACAAACQRGSGLLDEVLPAELRDRLELAPLADALQSLHEPPDELSAEEVERLNEGRSEWHRRLAFEELFVLALIVAKRWQEQRSHPARAYAAHPDCSVEALEALLGFEPTAAQARVIAEIAADLNEERPMNRLLQGDVGAGKTAVAFAAALQVIRSGAQVAIMAPTSILAEQHLRSFETWCERAGIKCALLTAATPKAVRATTLALLDAGEIDLLIGTHALLADSVAFAELGLAIIDEQHRFGVAQRAKLRAKGRGLEPHLLVMTATPIPRTLALTAYGELDVSVIDEMPPGREPPRTQILLGAKGRRASYRALARRLEQGQRAFVVCPLVERPDEERSVDYANACELAEELRAEFSSFEVGLVHGRMSVDERDLVMDRFRCGEVQVLVATTVIEVGVDVPEAVVMLIEDADHFGLAQLHQLRGRVGRGGGSSECVLLSSGRASEEGRERLDILVETNDGFVIAEEDLRMRGPGELLGIRQAGLPRLRFGDLREHGELVAMAKTEAHRLLEEDPKLESHAALRALIERRTREVEAYGSEGG